MHKLEDGSSFGEQGLATWRLLNIKTNSKLKPFHSGRGPIRLANCSKRLQYTLNGYFEGRFCHSSKRALTYTRVKASSS